MFASRYFQNAIPLGISRVDNRDWVNNNGEILQFSYLQNTTVNNTTFPVLGKGLTVFQNFKISNFKFQKVKFQRLKFQKHKF